MRKPYQKSSWPSRSSSDASSEKTPVTQQPINFIALARNWGLIGLLVIGLALLYKEVSQPEVILEPIEVPEDIAELGYTGVVVAEQLADAAINIELETRELSSQSLWHKDAMNMREVRTTVRSQDITLPGSPFTIRSIARFIRQELGLHSDYLRGEIVHENKLLTLTLRNLSDAKVPAVRISNIRVEQLLQEGGVAIMQLTTPSALAIHAYHKFINQFSDSAIQKANYNKAVRLFEYCLKYPPASDDPLVLFIWGNAHQDLNRPEEAIEQYRKATDIDPKYADAYYTWGTALQYLNRPKEAIEQYRKAIDIDPKHAQTFLSWGYTLDYLKRPEEAIKQYRKAIEIAPKLAYAYNNLGIAFVDLKRPDEAIEQYRKAIEIDSKLADAYNNWGNALIELKRPDEAIEQYRKAIEIDPKIAYA